jgi:hypothetical protein
MEILWWLAPPVVATVVAMLWVSWLGRAGRGEVDPEVAVRRLGEAMSRPSKVSTKKPAVLSRDSERTGDRSTGVALRRTPRTSAAVPASPEQGRVAPRDDSTRRAS